MAGNTDGGEKVVKCPVPNCEAEKLRRSIHLHIRQSSGGGHGEHGDTPDTYKDMDTSELEVVGVKNVNFNYPDERDEQDDTVRLCPYCGQSFDGYRSLAIHVGQAANKPEEEKHPEDASDKLEPENAPIAQVDAKNDVIEIVKEGNLMPSTKHRILSESEGVSPERIQDFIDELKEEGHLKFARRVENKLLEGNQTNATSA